MMNIQTSGAFSIIQVLYPGTILLPSIPMWVMNKDELLEEIKILGQRESEQKNSFENNFSNI